jgi:hypothetical protein
LLIIVKIRKRIKLLHGLIDIVVAIELRLELIVQKRVEQISRTVNNPYFLVLCLVNPGNLELTLRGIKFPIIKQSVYLLYLGLSLCLELRLETAELCVEQLVLLLGVVLRQGFPGVVEGVAGKADELGVIAELFFELFYEAQFLFHREVSDELLHIHDGGGAFAVLQGGAIEGAMGGRPEFQLV